MPSLRTLLSAVVFVFGALATTATSGPSASISGTSEEQTLALDAATPALAFDATATLTSDVPVVGGELGLSVFLDADAAGSLKVGLLSRTSGGRQELDIVDTQAQGSARIGIEAFASCEGIECIEGLELTFERTDQGLEGQLGLSFQLDGFADTDGTPTEGDIVFAIQR
ncbi:MAG: hypothetical protein FJ137_15575 [Deltaproteobacteria bacterium]|nr:hypothetical protein [Deltaproteobacteria bacterium]